VVVDGCVGVDQVCVLVQGLLVAVVPVMGFGHGWFDDAGVDLEDQRTYRFVLSLLLSGTDLSASIRN